MRPVFRHWCPGAGRRQEFEVVERCWIRPGVISLLRQSRKNCFRLIVSILNHLRDFAWWRGGTTDLTNARTGDFFGVCFTVFGVRFSTSDFHYRILQKKSVRSGLMILECSFPFRRLATKEVNLDRFPNRYQKVFIPERWDDWAIELSL